MGPQGARSKHLTPEKIVAPIMKAIFNDDLSNALLMAKDALEANASNALFHRVHGEIRARLGARAEDRLNSFAHFLYAHRSAKKAVELRPNVIEFRYFYAYLIPKVCLFDKYQRAEVLWECDMALALEEPKLSFWDMYQPDRMRRGGLRTEKERLNRVKKDLRDLKAGVMARHEAVGSSAVEEEPQGTVPEGMDLARMYWDSLSTEKKRRFLEVKVKDLIEHCDTTLLEDGSASKILDEIVPFVEENSIWRFSLCHGCERKLHTFKVLKRHGCFPFTSVKTLLADLRSILYVDVDDETKASISGRTWEPFDAALAAVKEIETERLTVEETPLLDHKGRSRYLKEIQDTFKKMIKRKRLWKCHLDWSRLTALKRIEGYSYSSQLVRRILHHDLHHCIGFLEEEHLQEVLGVLRDHFNACESPQFTVDYDLNDALVVKHPLIFFSSISYSLILDPQSFRNIGTTGDAEIHDPYDFVDRVDIDKLLSWIFSDSFSKERLVAFIQRIEEKKQKGKDIFQMFKENIDDLRAYHKSHSEFLEYNKKATQVVDNLFTEEQKKSDRAESDHVALLQKKREELDKIETLSRYKQLYRLLKSYSNLDYRGSILLLMASFLQARLLRDVEAAKKDLELSHEEKRNKEKVLKDSKGSALNGNNIPGVGLKNEVGDDNHFLNVIIQLLWHLKQFRDQFISSYSTHKHVGEHCLACDLQNIFNDMEIASKERKEPVTPHLWSTLNKLYRHCNHLQGRKDVSEVLAVIFWFLHRSFGSSSENFGTKSEESCYLGDWDCEGACLAHSTFGMNISEEVELCSCKTLSNGLKYTSFFHNVGADAILNTKREHPDSYFDQLLKHVITNHQQPCDREGCEKTNPIYHELLSAPHIFAVVLSWQNACESEDISQVLAAITTEVDLGIIYRLSKQSNKHSLVSVVCRHHQYFICFIYSHEHEQWIKFADETVEKVGGWDSVRDLCGKEYFQPQIIFFEDGH